MHTPSHKWKLGQNKSIWFDKLQTSLILVLMDAPLEYGQGGSNSPLYGGFNPCFNGSYSAILTRKGHIYRNPLRVGFNTRFRKVWGLSN